MRRAIVALAGLALVACGGGSPSATPPPLATATISASPTVNTAATATRDAELGQLATSQAQSVQIATLTAALNAPSPTALPAPTTASLPTIAPPTPAATTVPPPPVPPPTAVPAATSGIPAGAQVVRGLDNDPVNVRELPTMQAPVVALLNPNTDAEIAGPPGTDEQGRRWLWIRLGPGGKDGYVRADLVSEPRASQSSPQQAAVPPTPAAGPKGTLTDAEIAQRSKYTRVEIADLTRNPSRYTGSSVRIEGTILQAEIKTDAKIQAVIMVIQDSNGDYAQVSAAGAVSEYPAGKRIAAYGLAFGTGSLAFPSGGSIRIPYVIGEIVDFLT